jgi:hypothetical protein
VDRILADHKQAIAAAEEATVEAAATICDEFRVVHETNCDAADDEMDADIEHGLYMAAKELTVKIRALAHTSILANREAEIRRQARLKEAEWWADHDVEDYDLQSQWDEMCRERLAELTAPPTTGTAASDT